MCVFLILDHLKSRASEYARKLNFNVKIIRLTQRSGLIVAKQTGCYSAKGEIVVFLDSHCEVMDGWLPPLVHRVAQNRFEDIHICLKSFTKWLQQTPGQLIA